MSEAGAFSEQDREELIAYLDGELEPERARLVEEKLQRDPAWRREAEQLQTTWEMLDYLPQARATTAFTEQTLTLFEAVRSRQTRWRRWWRRIGIVTWIAAGILVGFLGFQVGQKRNPAAAPDQSVPPPSEEVLSLLEYRDYWPYYQKVGSFQFLQELDRSGLFDEGS